MFCSFAICDSCNYADGERSAHHIQGTRYFPNSTEEMTAMTSNDIQQQQQHNGQANEVESSLSFARKRSRNGKVFNPGALYDAEDDERSRNSFLSQPNQER